MSEVRTVLRPPRQPLVGYLLMSVLGHGGLLVFGLIAGLLGRACNPSKPIIDLDRSMEVSMVALPRSDTRMPDRAARAPVPKGGESSAAKEAAPPPPKTSDLVVHDKPEPKEKVEDKAQGTAEREGIEQDRRRQELMEQLRRQELLDQLLDAPVGAADRDATDPDSDSDIRLNATGSGSRGDPEYARYITEVRQIFMQHFNPLPAVRDANPGISTRVKVWVDPQTGRILRWEVARSSEVPAFDAAAERAVQSVGKIPLPPEKYRDLLNEPYVVNFT